MAKWLWAPAWLAAVITIAAPSSAASETGSDVEIVGLAPKGFFGAASAGNAVLSAAISLGPDELAQGLSLAADQFSGTLYVVDEMYHRVGQSRIADSLAEPVEKEIVGENLIFRGRESTVRVTIVFRPEENALFSDASAVGDVTILAEDRLLFPENRGDFGRSWSGHKRFGVDAGHLVTQARTLTTYSGPIEFYIWECEITYSDRGQPSSFQSGTLKEPVVPGAVQHETDRFAHFVGDVRNLTVGSTTTFPLWLELAQLPFGPAPVVFQEATGSVITPQERIPFRLATLTFDSNETTIRLIRPDSPELGFSFHVIGRVESITIDGEEIRFVGPPSMSPTDAAVVGATILSILAGAWALLRGKGLVLWPLLSRRTRVTGYAAYMSATVSNPRRRRTLDLIKARPGIQGYHVWQQVGGAFGVTLRNLTRLEDTGLVRSVRIGRFRHYYLKTAPADAESHRRAFLATRTGRETYLALRRLGKCRQRELAVALGITTGAVSTRLRRLQEFGLAERVGSRAHGFYRARSVDLPADYFDERPDAIRPRRRRVPAFAPAMGPLQQPPAAPVAA